MATVYHATDEVLGRQVAVKIMHPALAADAGFVERFRREAQNAARLNHPNVVTVHDWGREGDTTYMVMEYVHGQSLRDLLDRRARLDLDSVRAVVRGMGAALDHAHAKGIVHRDVKPENVLLADGEWTDRTVKVVDFGVARALAESRLTTDSVIGTMHYIAPEQLSDGEVDARADVYALGVMTYELLTGQPAFTGATPAAVAAARLARSVPSPGVSPQIDGAIARATALRPQDRTASAGEFAAALGTADPPAQFRDTMPTRPRLPRQPTTVMPHHDPPRRRRSRAWITAIVVLALAAGAAVVVAWPRSVAVPDLHGRRVDEAPALLRAAGLRAGVHEEIFDDRPAGTILRTKPAAKASARRGSPVAIVASKGPEFLDVPAVVGKTPEEARTILQGAGFRAGNETEDFDLKVGKGLVARQLPADGKAKRGTAVDLVVSKGPDLVVVPDVANKPPDDAKAAIQGAGFVYARGEDWSESVAQGVVIRTNPGAGQKAPRGTTVTAVVSKGPKPFPMPSLVGMDRGAARAKAQSLGLVVANEYAVPGSGKQKGQVQGQNPPEGTEVRKGSRVDLYYAA
jgi:serine/threonine-protein kinase